MDVSHVAHKGTHEKVARTTLASITMSITQRIPAIGNLLPDKAGSAVLAQRSHVEELASPSSKDFLRTVAEGSASCRDTHTMTTAVNTQTFDGDKRQSNLDQKDTKK